MTPYQLELGPIKAHKTGNRIFSYIASEDEERESGLGRIFIFLEILSTSKESFAVCPELIAVLKDNFYHSPSSSIEASLELACQKANSYFSSEPLDHYKMYSKLSMVVFATHEDQISVAHLNNGSLLLVRKNKVNSITERQSVKTKKGEKPKLFMSITSGTLGAGDTLIASTRPLTDFFSEEKLKSILKQIKTADAGLAFANDIQNIPTNVGFEGVVIKIARKAQTPQTAVSATAIQHASVESSMEGLQSLESKTGRLLSLSAWNSMKKKVGGVFHSLSKPRAQIFSELKQWFPKGNDTPKKSDSLKDRSILPSKLPQEVFSRPLERFRSLFQLRNRYLGIGVVLLVLFIVTTIIQTKGLTFSSPNKTFLNAAKNSVSQAEVSLIYQNEEAAKKQLQDAKSSLESLGNKSNDESRAVADKITGLEKKLYLVSDASAEALIDFSSLQSRPEAQWAFSGNGKLYELTRNPFELLEMNISAKSANPIVTDPALASFGSRFASADKTGVFVSDGSTIHYINLKEKKSLMNTAIPTTAMVSYAERLYAVSGNQIYRIDKQPNALTRSLWITDGTVVENAKSIAIDGDVYVGTSNGVLKYTKGEKQKFSLPQLDTPTSPDFMTTSIDSKYIFILDSSLKRIVILEKSGKLFKQLALTGISSTPTSFVTDEIKKTIYLSAGNAIWKVSY